MADIEIGPLHDRLGEDEMAELTRALAKAGVGKLPRADDSGAAPIAKGIDDDVLAEFMDHLEANDIACEIYLPVEFDGRYEAADLRVGSVSVLIDVLEELKEDLAIENDDDADDEDEDEDDEDEEEDALRLVEEQLRQVWKYFHDGAHSALDRGLPLFVFAR